MSPERFRQIEELYHAAREATADERAALLARADPELRHEVELLLAERNGGEFLDRPAIEHAFDLLEDSAAVALAAGARLGPYCIEHKLGEGGMGEVFRAVDTRLGRAVAIKITHEQFSARFQREGRAIASLNHPNICTVHDVGPNYLVMELVEGETLAARLKSGPLPMNTALLYASQIAAALAEAHAKDIVHRDLKPGNIMIARSGIKVLDFGLARSGQDQTVTASRTVMGTPGYMAPEQREGKPADARADIYSFGCVLYEMFTGAAVGPRRRRFPSRKLEKIASRCLEEDPGRRWQSVAELQRELAGVTATTTHGTRVFAAAVAMLALFAAAYFYFQPAPRLTDKDMIVLADFTNRTGDPVFDETLRQGLAVQLEQSPFLSLVSDQRIRRTLPLMNVPPDARLTPEIAQGVCVRTASAAVLEGSIATLGSQYVLGLRAKNCTTGDILADDQAQAARKEEVLGALSQIASRFRTRVGESLATIEKHSTPLEEATTPSLEALKAYSAAWKALMSAGWVRAQPLFQRAIAIDPDFAMAHAQVGFGYSVMGESTLARPSTLKAYQLRDRASDVERFYIDTLYDRDFTGNLEREQRTLESWAESYPRDARPHGLVVGSCPDEHRPIRAVDRRSRQGHRAGSRPDACVYQQGHQSALPESSRRCLADGSSRDGAQAGVRRVVYRDSVFRRLPEGRRRRTQTDGGGRPGRAPPRKTSSRTWRRWRWLAPAACTRRDGCPRSPSRSRSGRVGANGPACSKRPQPYGKRFTGMRPPPGRAPPRRSISEGAAKWTMPRRSRWPSQVICRNREPWPRISRASSPRIRWFNSCICRRFGPCSH